MRGATLPLQGKRVLILEDEYFIANDLSEALRSAGAEVVGPFNRAPPALAAILTQVPDYAVVDINLGGIVSYEVADALVAQRVPFVIASGYERSAMPARYAEVPFCQKPVSTNDVLLGLAQSATANASKAS
jgi:CheY-like chemotaxis protein